MVQHSSSIITDDLDIQECIDLMCAARFVRHYLNDTVKNWDAAHAELIIDKSVVYDNYLNYLREQKLKFTPSPNAISKAPFSYLFKSFCAYYGVQTLIKVTSKRKQYFSLKKTAYFRPSKD